MKRIVAITLSLILMFTFVSCADGNNDNNISSADSSRLTLSTGATVPIKDYVAKGEIFNCEFKVGTPIQSIKDAYHYGDDVYWGTSSNEGESDSSEVKNNIDATPLEIYGEDPIRMITGDAKYYYHPAAESKGIAFVAYFGDAYGFRVGISEPEDIRKAIGDIASVDGFANGEDLFFFFGQPEGVYQLEYTFDNAYTLSFYFENGKLAATTLYGVELWITEK